MRFNVTVGVLLVIWAVAMPVAQERRDEQDALPGGFDAAAVERGRQLSTTQCGFCHGTSARGGAGGPDLTRSPIVQEDEGGKQLGAFLKVGRPERGMPAFQHTEQQTSDLAAFLHAAIYLAANRRYYQVLDIVTGDAQAGERNFNGNGKCSTCHSVSGDLKGIGAKYDPTALQGRIVMPRQGRGPGGQGPPAPSYLDRNAVKATVTLPAAGTVSGTLVRLTDFDVTIYDPATGEMRSWLRKNDLPKVVVTDPVQAHLDMWTRWTDEDLHNMTAYLVTVK
jgi:cytochrome c oxidase cbb3-type subunit III